MASDFNSFTARSQKFIFGSTATERISHSKVFIAGQVELGIEVALHLVDYGVKEITFDAKRRKHQVDKLTQERLESLINKSDSHNTKVTMNINEEVQLNDVKFWQQYDCVFLTGIPLEEQLKVNKICRELKPPVKFISAESLSSFGYIFCDFGDAFVINDLHSGQTEAIVGELAKEKPTKLELMDKSKHEFRTGDKVQYIDIDENHFLHGRDFTITVTSETEFTVDLERESGELNRAHCCGKIVLKGRLREFPFRSLEQELSCPTLNNKYHDVNFVKDKLDFVNILKESTFKSGLDERELESGSKASLKLNRNTSLPEIEASESTRHIISTIVCSILSGQIANEIVKCITRQFKPIVQWEIWDFNEFRTVDHRTLANDLRQFSLDVSEERPLSFSPIKVFVIGCKAICSVLLRNFAYLPKCNSKSLKVSVSLIDFENTMESETTDKGNQEALQDLVWNMDCRTLLEVAGLEIKVIRERFHPEKKSTFFTDEFFQNQDVVISAVDSTVTRRHLNRRCVANGVALIDIGTAGFKGHVQVMYPHVTESYSSQRDPVDKEVPYCVLKSFPESVEHTVVWAREKFFTMFQERPKLYNNFWDAFESPSKLWKANITPLPQQKSVLTAVTEEVVSRKGWKPEGFVDAMKLLVQIPCSFRGCLFLARAKFDQNFNFKARQLLHSLPLTTTNSDGSLFWSYPKRVPKPIDFSSEEPLHILFVTTVAKLYAKMYNIEIPDKGLHTSSLLEVLGEYKSPEFHTTQKDIETNPDAKKTDKVDESKTDTYIKHLEDISRTNSDAIAPLTPANFSKYLHEVDHSNFIFAASSLRATMYGIVPVDLYQTKLICGNLQPMLHATSTVAAGLATLEFVKVISRNDREFYCNSFFNLSLPLLIRASPAPPLLTAIKGPIRFTEWDRWEVLGNPNFTLEDFTKHFQEKYTLKVSLVVQGVKIIYMPFMPGHSKRLKERMCLLLDASTDKNYTDLTVSFENEGDCEGEDAPAPPVRYYLS